MNEERQLLFDEQWAKCNENHKLNCIAELERYIKYSCKFYFEQGFTKGQVSVRRDEIAELVKEVQFYKDSLSRIANEFGITSPLQLVMLAENNEETYVDTLIKAIRRKKYETITCNTIRSSFHSLS